MEIIKYTTSGTCSSEIQIAVYNDTVEDVYFTGGCSGNLSGIRALIIGMKIEDVIRKLSGIKCGSKDTSCPDQLAAALKTYLKNKQKQKV